MIGTYTFKENGEVVGQSTNLITTAGKKAIIDYFAGYTQAFAGSLLVGIGSAAANVADKSLLFEITRMPIDLSSADYANNGVVFKAQIPADQDMIIYEAGMQSTYSVGSAYDSQLLLDFNVLTDVWSAGTYDASFSRLGQALRLSPALSTTTTATLQGLYFDLSGYGDVDQFSIAYRAATAFVASLKIRLKTDASNYYEYTIATPANGVYNVTTFNKSAMTVVGTPSWSSITIAEVLVTATAGGVGTLDLDGLRIEDRDSYREDNVLVSRSVLATPVTKSPAIPLDIEYTVTL